MKLSDFEKKWSETTSLADKIGMKLKELFTRREPIKHRLVMAYYKIRSLINRLEVTIDKLRDRDRTLFERLVDFIIQGDQTRALAYANEIAEVRKFVQQVAFVQAALEHVALKLETVIVVGDVVSGLVPIMAVIKELKPIVKGIMPEVSIELMDLEDSLKDVVTAVGEALGTPLSEPIVSPEAKKILEEARMVAEQKMKEKFPEIPLISTVGKQQEKQETSEQTVETV